MNNLLRGLFSQSPTYADVKAFLEARVRESALYDYKRELPVDSDKIAKGLVSFANTVGGVLLVGVDQAADGGPVLPACGVNEPERALMRVQQIANERVDPPVAVDVERVEIPAGEPYAGNYVLLVRVPESAQAPHMVVATAAIFVRMGDHASRDVFPSMKVLELLFRRRAGPENLREELWERADGRSPRSDTEGPRFAFGVGPMYPRASLASEVRVRELVLKAFEGAPVRTVVGGAHADDADIRNSPSHYAELFTHGFHFEAGKFPHGGNMNLLNLEWLIETLGGCWRRGRGFLKELDVHGLLRLRVELRNVGGWRVAGLGVDTTCLEHVVRHEDAINSWQFASDDSTLARAVHFLRWGLGHHSDLPGESELVRRALRPR